MYSAPALRKRRSKQADMGNAVEVLHEPWQMRRICLSGAVMSTRHARVMTDLLQQER